MLHLEVDGGNTMQQCAETDRFLEDSVLNGMSSSDLSPQGSGSYKEEDMERQQEPERMGDSKETAFQTQQN